MNLQTFNFLIIIVSFFFVTAGEKVKKVVKKRPAVLQNKYNSSDPLLQEFLKFADSNQIFDVEGTFYVRISTTKYAVSVSPMNWFKSYEMCRLKGGYLLDSKQKFQQATEHLTRIAWPVALRFWFGATCLTMENSFRWFSSGHTLVSSDFSWAPGEPKEKSNACIFIEKTEKVFVMKTGSCELRYLALCEILEIHKHFHTGVSTRKKKNTLILRSLFS